MKTKYLIVTLMVLLMTASMNLCIAQEEDPPPEEPGPLPDTPVDGLSLLLAAGAAYGVRRLRVKRRNRGALRAKEGLDAKSYQSM